MCKIYKITAVEEKLFKFDVYQWPNDIDRFKLDWCLNHVAPVSPAPALASHPPCCELGSGSQQ